ncbi:alpha/beta hydrolase [Uliginosibacterium sp. H1]|uniref:alpha/beta hydrolase n=1 Tax=Uliginosibacterium sp. H1 TaxID=3114757 RepID=UPI002E177388|nr:alpha/beta fold hydrolase [Uliginosibacterium sp. H1]
MPRNALFRSLRPRAALGALCAAVFILLGATACQSVDGWQRGLIYRPSAQLERTPDNAGLGYQDVWIDAPAAGSFNDGKVHGWWLPAREADAPALLFLHGNAGNLGYNLGIVERLATLGYSVLAIDYRGFGRSSPGVPDEPALYADAQAAWKELAKLAPRASRRVIYGHSLGGAVAIDLASRVPDAGALIVESSFTSMADMAEVRGYGWLPVSFILTQHFASRDKIARVSVPTLFIHGERDGMVPATMSRQLFELAKGPKELLIVPGARHANAGMVAGEQWRQAIQQVSTPSTLSAAVPALPLGTVQTTTLPTSASAAGN